MGLSLRFGQRFNLSLRLGCRAWLSFPPLRFFFLFKVIIMITIMVMTSIIIVGEGGAPLSEDGLKEPEVRG